jgi:hypothetical protein
MKKINFIVSIVLLLLFTSCLPETVNVQDCVTSLEPDGFWMGLWHGIILPISFIWSLFDNSVSIYEIANNGNWYNLGFVLGAGALFGGSSSK